MKDRLPKEHKRINWIDILCSFLHENSSFELYCKKHKKVKSVNKLAYLYLLSTYGRKFIAQVRLCPEKYTLSEMIRISHKSWLED